MIRDRDQRTRWYESDDPDRVVAGVTSRMMIWVVALTLFVLALGAGVWAFNVATSDVKGRGDAVRIKNRAEGRIAAQERFEELFADIKATDRKLDVLAADAAKGDPAAVTRLAGAKSYCLDIVGDYNAEARKYTAEQFRSADLPSQIDTNDPATDCEESGK